MERLSNNEFHRKSMPQQTQYLKDCNDENINDHVSIKRQLKAILGILSFLAIAISGIAFDSIFIH